MPKANSALVKPRTLLLEMTLLHCDMSLIYWRSPPTTPLATLFVGLAVLLICHSAKARDVPEPALRSTSVLILDDGNAEPLLARQSATPAPIASITKLMTALVVLDAEQPLD